MAIPDRTIILALLHNMIWENSFFLFILLLCYSIAPKTFKSKPRYSIIERMPKRYEFLKELTYLNDIDCIDNLRMDRRCFARLCTLLTEFGNLGPSRYVCVTEKVAYFLAILAHHAKNRTTRFHFKRSGDTVSKYFNEVLNCVVKIPEHFLVSPTVVDEDCDVYAWKPFQGCLGALDGTFVEMTVPKELKPRYRSRKGVIATNVLGVCDIYCRFVYVLAGWEGSAADGRVLRDAVARPNGLKVLVGSYYLCDNGYTNCDGFMTGYRGVRYHLKEWGIGNAAPQNPREYFNLKHSKARNAIERTFGQLKGRWAILRSPAFNPVKTQSKIIMACAYLHNFIKNNISVDPMDEVTSDDEGFGEDDMGGHQDYIDVIESTQASNHFRDDLAQSMFNNWQATYSPMHLNLIPK